MKKLICILLVVLMLTALGAAAYADSGIGVEPGQKMPDFTIQLTDGTTAKLSELLKEKDLVVLNIFASWCGPCEREFPEMEAVYQAYSDKMIIVSASGDPNDTMDIISAYKDSHNLSFPMGLASEDMYSLGSAGFPTTIFIDRDGNVGFIKIGAFASREEFEGKVNTFLDPNYDGKPLASEKAVNILPYLLIFLALSNLLLVIGRWCLLRKAGRPGWHALIPFLNSYKEYSLCWNGWFGIIAEACVVGSYFINGAGIVMILHYALLAMSFLLGIPESLKLAKAFGQGKLAGVLMMIPGLKEISRFVLGVSKAKYVGTDSEAAA